MEVNYFVFGCCSGDDEADHDVFYRDKACKLVQCWSRWVCVCVDVCRSNVTQSLCFATCVVGCGYRSCHGGCQTRWLGCSQYSQCQCQCERRRRCQRSTIDGGATMCCLGATDRCVLNTDRDDDTTGVVCEYVRMSYNSLLCYCSCGTVGIGAEKCRVCDARLTRSLLVTSIICWWICIWIV